MLDKKAYVLARKYTDESIEGTAGVLAGKNCIIQSVEEIEGGQRVTFAWVRDDGTSRTTSIDIMDGLSGEGVPAGGTIGQLLVKRSGDDFDFEWQDPDAGTGTKDYERLFNHPVINGVEIVGDITFSDLGWENATDEEFQQEILDNIWPN